jgi:hypothetical protein
MGGIGEPSRTRTYNPPMTELLCSNLLRPICHEELGIRTLKQLAVAQFCDDWGLFGEGDDEPDGSTPQLGHSRCLTLCRLEPTPVGSAVFVAS